MEHFRNWKAVQPVALTISPIFIEERKVDVQRVGKTINQCQLAIMISVELASSRLLHVLFPQLSSVTDRKKM